MKLKRRQDRSLIFDDYPEFRPNLTPREVILKGSFGGTYYREIYSSITKKHYKDEHKKLGDLFKDVPKKLLTNEAYDKSVNKYKVKCGSSLEEWESKGWITKYNPYGWFDWFCHFYLGRRCDDDERQIKRWNGIAGSNGRFRKRLINLIKDKQTTYDNYEISPTIRQTLLHWAYEVTADDLKI